MNTPDSTKYDRTDTGHRHEPLHRIATVRCQQEISLRVIARRLKTRADQLRAEENEFADLTLSRVYQWQRVLGVPLHDLLIDSDAPLADPVRQRAKMLRAMKTVAAILKKSKEPAVHRLAQTLAGQLIEIMPELAEVGAGPEVGLRRPLSDLGRAAEQVVPHQLNQRHDDDRGNGD